MAIITDVEAAESCAESCFRRGMGPGAGGDSCVAWRLDSQGNCKLASGCYYPELADSMLLGSELWNTIEGVDAFNGAPQPQPKQVRKYRAPASN